MKASITLSELDTLISQIFSSAAIFKSTSDEIQDRLKAQIFDPLNAKYPSGKPKFSNYLKGYAQGCISIHRARIMNELTEFCYNVNGELYSTHKQTDKRQTEEFYQAGRGSELGNYPNGFYWKGSTKPYYIGTDKAD